jgi:hypothetical protein
MKRYTARDESAGYVASEDKGLTLQGINYITDFTETQFDIISEMKINEKLNFDGITVERTN